MRLSIISLFVLLAIQPTKAQQPISIDDSDMPGISDTFRYSITDDLTGLIDLSIDGPDQTWDFSTLGSFEQRLDTFVDPIFDTPMFYNVTFSNIFDMEHFATLAKRNTQDQFGQGFVQVENVFDFYRNTGSLFANVGMGMTINGIPLTSTMEPRDIIYRFPMEYGDSDDSFAQYGFEVPEFGYYGQKIWRSNTVDSWGEVTTRFGTFNAIRVATTIDITDTLSSQGFGFEIPRPTEYHIKWMVKDIGTPVITVVAQDVFGQLVVSSVEYLDSIREFTMPSEPIVPPDTTDTTNTAMIDIMDLFQMNVWPNPAHSELNVGFTLNEPLRLTLQLKDITGRRLLLQEEKEFAPGSHVWQHQVDDGIESGIYLLVIENKKGRVVSQVLLD